MRSRVSVNAGFLSVQEAWEHYQTTRECLVQAIEGAKRSIISGGMTSDQMFFGMTTDELDGLLVERLDESDKQASMFLIASTEATLAVDFLRRVQSRKKDPVSRAFRGIHKTACRRSRGRFSFEKDILNTWEAQTPAAKHSVGQLRGAMKYRHWLAHGRYWPPKWGQRYEPSGLLRIIFNLFQSIGLPDT